ncbi:unnamed protein product [Tetraodon nigroviridis]|uniref:(spotted green pufferfish) hypothetical protein n=1 Tax=Tetraodon nigroviridis TaxID=99883 RepID=Q4RSQ8_TETNG|nr:unnamed protein product [Tetraodon nigroviridis]
MTTSIKYKSRIPVKTAPRLSDQNQNIDASLGRSEQAEPASSMSRPRGPEPEEKQYVGFSSLPSQVNRKSVKKGFDFTLMVAGESGMGKSTLINSLFLTDLYRDRKLLNAEGESSPLRLKSFTSHGVTQIGPLCPSERINQTVEITKHTVDIEEKGVKLKLTIVDTPGFGDAVNNHECLRPVDVEFMKALHEKVNTIPLIAKADCLTPHEVKKLKDRIREEIDKFGIKVYQLPECDSDEDEEFKQLDKELKESTPFAVIGSNTVVEARGQRVRGRLYPWGIVEVENQSHCDFVKLRNMLICSHMHDLKDVTCDIHYENYRAPVHTGDDQGFTCLTLPLSAFFFSKLAEDNHMESPVAILPLPTHDGETEKLIRIKDKERAEVIGLPSTVLLSGQPGTTKLYLHGNQLTSLPNGLLDELTLLRSVSLHDNPWVCDCGILYLRAWLLRQPAALKAHWGVSCNSPASLRGRQVVYLTEEEVLKSCHYWYCDLAVTSQLCLLAFVAIQAALLIALLVFLKRFEKLSKEARRTREESFVSEDLRQN